MPAVKWKKKPDAHDYPAASDYLSLLVADPVLRAELVGQLQAAPVIHYKAKDLLRASQLSLLTATNAHVATDLKKIRKRLPLSPVLLVRGDLVRGFPLQIADGYHRICASHLVDENTDIPCRLIDLPAATPRPRVPRAAKPTESATVTRRVVRKSTATPAPTVKVAQETPVKRAAVRRPRTTPTP